MSHEQSPASIAAQSPRRSFLVRLAALAAAGILAVFPFAAGWGVLFHPLRRRHNAPDAEDDLAAAGFLRICPLEALPDDGVPRAFPVVADVADAWTRLVGQRIGSVFLARTQRDSEPYVTAFTSICPHLGCAIEFQPARDRFECPCHVSGFDRDGQMLFGPSLRGLDPLEVRLLESGGTAQVWVAYQRFRAGVAERIPVA